VLLILGARYRPDPQVISDAEQHVEHDGHTGIFAWKCPRFVKDTMTSLMTRLAHDLRQIVEGGAE